MRERKPPQREVQIHLLYPLRRFLSTLNRIKI
nr:MAG TPA: hypothetical protein [Caudoviricetes sp.]